MEFLSSRCRIFWLGAKEKRRFHQRVQSLRSTTNGIPNITSLGRSLKSSDIRSLCLSTLNGWRQVVRDRHEISVSSYATIRTNCIVPFSVERVGTNIYLCDL